MIKIAVDVPALIKSIVPTAITVDGAEKPVYFMDGTPLEILQRLTEMDASKTYKFKKYPLIILVHDFTQKIYPRPGVWADLNLNFLIVNYTEQSYNSEQRREFNFTPILRPIYVALMNALMKSPDIMGYEDQLPHDYTERYYWGRNGIYGHDGKIFADRLDAIDVQNLKISIDKKTCLKWQN